MPSSPAEGFHLLPDVREESLSAPIRVDRCGICQRCQGLTIDGVCQVAAASSFGCTPTERISHSQQKRQATRARVDTQRAAGTLKPLPELRPRIRPTCVFTHARDAGPNHALLHIPEHASPLAREIAGSRPPPAQKHRGRLAGGPRPDTVGRT